MLQTLAKYLKDRDYENSNKVEPLDNFPGEVKDIMEPWESKKGSYCNQSQFLEWWFFGLWILLVHTKFQQYNPIHETNGGIALPK